jgi:hypothetical protein
MSQPIKILCAIPTVLSTFTPNTGNADCKALRWNEALEAWFDNTRYNEPRQHSDPTYLSTKAAKAIAHIPIFTDRPELKSALIGEGVQFVDALLAKHSTASSLRKLAVEGSHLGNTMNAVFGEKESDVFVAPFTHEGKDSNLKESGEDIVDDAESRANFAKRAETRGRSLAVSAKNGYSNTQNERDDPKFLFLIQSQMTMTEI